MKIHEALFFIIWFASFAFFAGLVAGDRGEAAQ